MIFVNDAKLSVYSYEPVHCATTVRGDLLGSAGFFPPKSHI